MASQPASTRDIKASTLMPVGALVHARCAGRTQAWITYTSSSEAGWTCVDEFEAISIFRDSIVCPRLDASHSLRKSYL